MGSKPWTVRVQRVRDMKVREEQSQEFGTMGRRGLNCDGPVGGGEKGRGKGD
jgi:hypothetical protein